MTSSHQRDATPRFAYAVLAHGDPDQAIRLVKAIRKLSPTCTVLINYNGPAWNAAQIDDRVPDAEVFNDVEPYGWGRVGMVHATLRMLERALAIGCNWVTTLSAADFPVTDLRHWERNVTTSGVDAWTDAELVRDGEAGSVEDGFRQSHRVKIISPKFPGLIVRLVNLAAKFPRVRTKAFRVKGGVAVGWASGGRDLLTDFYVGSQWMGLSDDMGRTVLNAIEKRPEQFEELCRSYIPDECVLQTLVHVVGKARINGQSTSFVEWSDRESGHPDAMTAESIKYAKQSGSPFARKFPVDSLLLDQLELEFQGIVDAT